MVASEPAVQHAPLRYRELELFKINMLTQSQGYYDQKILLTVEGIRGITWWCENISRSCTDIGVRTVDFVLETDISESGWGGCVVVS